LGQTLAQDARLQQSTILEMVRRRESTPATTASTATLRSTKTKPPSFSFPEPETESPVVITYQELYKRVNEVAAMLRDFAKLKSGDRVTIHMPMIPELPITMLACARLGVIHSVVFGGFSGEACGLRAADSGSRVLIYAAATTVTASGWTTRLAPISPWKRQPKDGQGIDKGPVWRRYPGKYSSDTPMIMGRDFFVDEVLKEYANHTVEPVSLDSEAPLFLMYTSGTTGKPRAASTAPAGISLMSPPRQVLSGHSSRRRLLVHGRHRLITGHSYIVYGPLALAATSVLYEGVPQFPDAGRPWRIAERLDVNIFHTSPPPSACSAKRASTSRKFTTTSSST